MMDYLLIEHKDKCGECRLIVFDERAVCGYNDRPVEIDNKPDWCPLRPVPEYVNPEPMAVYNAIMYAAEHTPQWEKGRAEGWNACLDAITGGDHE